MGLRSGLNIELLLSREIASPLVRHDVLPRPTDWAGSWLAHIASNTGGIQIGSGVFMAREFGLAQT